MRQGASAAVAGLACVVCLLGIPAGLFASDPGEAGPRDYREGFKVPNLNGTRFISSRFLPDPFVRTRINNSLGYGSTSRLEIPLIEIDGNPVLGLKGDLVYATLNLDYQHAVRDWLGVWGRVGLTGRLGNGVQALLSQGVSVMSGFELGWLFRLWQADRHIVSTSISMSNSSSTVVDIYGFVERAIKEGGFSPDNSIVRTAPLLRTNFDLRYALAATGAVGLQVTARGSYGEAVARALGNEWHYRVGAGVHINLDSSFEVPVGFLAGYSYGDILEMMDVAKGQESAATLNLSYTGRADFCFGFEVEYWRIPLFGLQEKSNLLTSAITMSYYF
jgi:hypothetical protein